MVLENGTYGKRLATISNRTGTETETISFLEGDIIDTNTVKNFLNKNHVTSVCCTHCETSTGVINPIEKLASIVKEADKGKQTAQLKLKFGFIIYI